MKQNLVLLLVSLTVAGIACKKDKTGKGAIPSPPTAEKKWIVTTVAGDGRPVFAEGRDSTASFRLPKDIAVTTNGTIYVADGLNHRIRKITGGQVTTFAGYGVQDTTNANGSSAGFGIPNKLATDTGGNLYTLDIVDARIRKITPSANVSTYAGIVARGFADGQAIIARFDEASGIVVDAGGNIYIGDAGNKRIRKINTNGQVITIAGTGVQGFRDGNGDTAQFFSPGGIVIDKQGNLFVADQSCIRKITPNGVVSTFAGNELTGYADGQSRVARFTLILDMVIDEQGNIYVSDENRIRKISIDGIVSTIAGSTQGYEDGDATFAKFNSPQGLEIDRQGNIYVADSNNHRVRKISFE